MTEFEQSELAKEVIEFHFPRFRELPQIDLYMDQVLSIIEDALGILSFGGKDKILTSSMVNNYVKQKVVSPPRSKKYSNQHVAYLLAVSVLKQVLSISEICRLIEVQTATYPVETAYDYLCQELENAIQAVFVKKDFYIPSSPSGVNQETQLVRAGVLSFASKLYLQKYLQYLEQQEAESR